LKVALDSAMAAVTYIIILPVELVRSITTQCKAIQAHTFTRKLFGDGRPNIHRIPPKPVKFGYDQHIARFYPVDQLNKNGPLFCSH
jgi:hypothetical protein